MTNQFSIPAVIVGERWQLGIGDPTFIGWFTVCAYLCACLLCARRAHTLQRCGTADGPPSTPWWFVAAAMLLLGVNKQLDLQSWMTVALRQMAHHQGWYEQRRTYQVLAIQAIAGVAAVSGVVVILLLRKWWREFWLALLGCGFLAAFVAIRAASFHNVDSLLSIQLGGINYNALIELTGIACSGLGAWRAPPLSPEKWNASSEPGAARPGARSRLSFAALCADCIAGTKRFLLWKAHPMSTTNRSNYSPYRSQNARLEPNEADIAPGAQVILAVVRGRWRAILALVMVSGVASLVACTVLRQVSATTNIKLSYHPLPTPPGPHVYSPPPIHAFIHVATSDQVMNRLIEQNAIPMKPTDLAERFVVHVPPPGSMIVVDLSWKDKQSTADMLNAWSGIFIDQVMLDRRKTLESHRQHVKGALDNKQAEIAEVRRELQAITGSLERSDGPTNSAAQILSRVNNRLQASEQQLDTVEVRREGNILRLQRLAEVAHGLQVQLQETLLTARNEQLSNRQRLYTPGSDNYRRLQEIADQIAQFTRANEHEDSYFDWKGALQRIGSNILGEFEAEVQSSVAPQETRMRDVLGQVAQLELEIPPLENEIESLKNRIADLKTQSRAVAPGSMDSTATRLAERMQMVDALESERSMAYQQLSNIEQLAQSSIPEISVSTAADPERAVVTSNRKKLFVLSFFFLNLLLVAPVMLGGVLAYHNNPLTKIMQSWGFPVLSEGIAVGPAIEAEFVFADEVMYLEPEECRILALRVRQSALRLTATESRDDSDPREVDQQVMQMLALRLQQSHEEAPAQAPPHAGETSDIGQKVMQLMALSMSKGGVHNGNVPPGAARNPDDLMARIMQFFNSNSTGDASVDDAVSLLKQGGSLPDDHRAGKVILFCGLDHDVSALPLVSQLSDQFVELGDRVLIVDADATTAATAGCASSELGWELPHRGSAPSGRDTGNRDDFEPIVQPPSARVVLCAAQPGREGMLRREHAGAYSACGNLERAFHEGIESTLNPGVDRVTLTDWNHGRLFTGDWLKQWMDAARRSYNMVLVAAPSTNRPSDFQKMAAHGDAVVLTANHQSLKGRYGRELVDDLVGRGIPILGVIR